MERSALAELSEMAFISELGLVDASPGSSESNRYRPPPPPRFSNEDLRPWTPPRRVTGGLAPFYTPSTGKRGRSARPSAAWARAMTEGRMPLCPVCETRNPRSALHCSRCREPLASSSESYTGIFEPDPRSRWNGARGLFAAAAVLFAAAGLLATSLTLV